MHLTLLGATGGLGRAVLHHALDDGHTVAALARDPARLDAPPPALRVVTGDLSDPSAVAEVVDGADAVISCVGVTRGQDPAVFGTGMQHLVEAMRAARVSRLIAVSGAGLELEGDAKGLGRRIVLFLLETFAADVLAGKQHEWEVIRASGLDWTLARPPRMVDAPARGDVAVDPHRVSGRASVPYADVARWMLDQVDDPTHVRAAPFVSGA